MPLISHEMPKQLFPIHDLINDYPYVLAHLLDIDKEYTFFYQEKLRTAPFSILDNSAFELGASIDLKQLLYLAKKYTPTHVVLPDVVNDYEKTISQYKESIDFISNNSSYKFKFIAVVQGNTFKQIRNCIEFYLNDSSVVRLIAFPFDLVPESEHVTVRYRFFKWLQNYDPAMFSKLFGKIHLLGCNNPVEFILFKNDPPIYQLINSIDTSSPIVNGWEGNKFGDHGLFGPKPKAKLAENLDIYLDNIQLETITHNITKFREYVRTE